MKLDNLNGADAAGFTAALGAIYEHSPWVAERAAGARPFADIEALHRAMSNAVGCATSAERLALARAHPDLAGRLARAGGLAPASAAEQAGLGLDRLGDVEFERFSALNSAYRSRFGFPFIIAVRRQTRDSILAAFEVRLTHDEPTELRIALAEIDEIARLRLQALLDD